MTTQYGLTVFPIKAFYDESGTFVGAECHRSDGANRYYRVDQLRHAEGAPGIQAELEQAPMKELAGGPEAACFPTPPQARAVSTLSLKVEPTAGSMLPECFSDASIVAQRLRLAWVSFKHNGLDCTAYPSGQGFTMDDDARIVHQFRNFGHEIKEGTRDEWEMVSDYYARKEREYASERERIKAQPVERTSEESRP